MISADATDAGDGGKIILWSDEVTRAYGSISAKGGMRSGNGGFVETSSKGYLDVTRAPDLTAAHGIGGTWLLDPFDITIVAGAAGTGTLDSSTPNFIATADNSTITNGVINAALDLGTSVTLDTNVSGVSLVGALGDITVNAAILRSSTLSAFTPPSL